MEASLTPEAEEVVNLIRRAVTSINENQSTQDFARSLGLKRGITGYRTHWVSLL